MEVVVGIDQTVTVTIVWHARLQKSVDRLGRAIEAAEEEMDAALKRTTEIHRSQLKQKELENLELQRVIGAKERSIDSLRDTLATTKRTYESKLSQAESALALKDAEVGEPLGAGSGSWTGWWVRVCVKEEGGADPVAGGARRYLPCRARDCASYGGRDRAVDCPQVSPVAVPTHSTALGAYRCGSRVSTPQCHNPCRAQPDPLANHNCALPTTTD